MEERRKYMRFDVLLDAILGRSGKKKKMKVNNFSRDGLGIVSDEKISEGEDVEIELMIPGDNIPVIVTGEIAWTVKNGAEEPVFKSGVKVKKIKSADRSKILQYVYDKWMRSKEKK